MSSEVSFVTRFLLDYSIQVGIAEQEMDSELERLAAVERQIAHLARRIGDRQYRDTRDGRAVLSVRVGDEVAALVRRAARERGCTIADLVRPAILAAVSQPSTHQLTERPSEQGFHMQARTIAKTPVPSDTARQALSTTLAEQARLARADAAVISDRRSRNLQNAERPGMMSEVALGMPPSLRRK
jgi:hypothetical protein